MKKLFKYIKGCLKYIFYKICYRKKIKITIFNSIEGQFKLSLEDNGKIEIGKKLMTRGPIYLNCLKNGYLKIGNNVFFNRNCSITSMDKIVIGNNCMIANNVVMVDHNHKNITKAGSDFTSAPIIVGDNVWIGANTTILKGITIGNGSIIAANSLVNKNIPAGETWGGVPAKKIK